MRPTKVLGIGAAMEVAVGAVHACARLMAGTVACWGGNTFGQLGNGSTANALSPQNVAGLSGVVQLASGDFFTCALKSDGSVWCWGNNDGGQLGNGLTVDSPWPVQVPEVSGATQIAAFGERFLSGGCANVCVLQQDRSVQCWGDNSFGQIGSGTISAGPMPPTLVVW
jgi:alpha-tubulin suppressor-like RCC1 family protein